MGLYDITVDDYSFEAVKLDKFRGKVLLIVNSSTKCIFAPQYGKLQEIYDKFHGNGFEILDFPCDQFSIKDLGTEEDINNFCLSTYNTSFFRGAKLKVNGSDESILYSYLKYRKPGLFSSKIKFNFTKFLVDQSGNVIKRYGPMVKPMRIAKDIDTLIGKGK